VRLLGERTAFLQLKIAGSLYTSPKWRALVAAIIAERAGPAKAWPVARLQPPMKVFRDHIVELRDGARLDERNLMLRRGQFILTLPVRGASAGFLLRPHQVREPGHTRILP
jgi:hypothetical protein